MLNRGILWDFIASAAIERARLLRKLLVVKLGGSAESDWIAHACIWWWSILGSSLVAIVAMGRLS